MIKAISAIEIHLNNKTVTHKYMFDIKICSKIMNPDINSKWSIFSIQLQLLLKL